MYRYITRWLVFLLLLASVVQADENPLTQEERLRTPVTVQQRMIMLPELLREIGKQTGVRLTCARDLSVDKLTVFVKDKPAVEVLTHIATLVMGEWHKTKGGYSLAQTAKARKWEEELLTWDRENRLQKARETIETYMTYSEKDYAELVRQVRQQREAKQAGKPPSVVVTPGGQQMRFVGPILGSGEDDYAELHNYLLGRILRGFTRAQWQAFWRGEVFVAATFDLPGALRLPPETLEWLRQSVQLELPYVQDELAEAFRRQRLSEAESTQHVLLLFALDEQSGSVRTTIARYNPESPSPRTLGTIGGAAMFTAKQSPHRLEEHPCQQYWGQWQTDPKNPSSPEWLASKIAPLPNAPKPTSEYSRFLFSYPPFTLADYLQWLSQNTSINILADAYRTAWNAYIDLPFHVPGETVGEWLRRIAKSFRKAWWHAEGEWLLVKHADFWRLRPTELPEAIVRQIEKKIARGQIDTLLDDYAALAGSITPAHRKRVQIKGGYAVRFPIYYIVQFHLPFLRFWASLNWAQKNATLRDGFIPLRTLSAKQRQTFMQCVMEDMLMHLGSIALPFEGLQEPPEPGLVASLIIARRYEAEGMHALSNWHSLEELQWVIKREKQLNPGKEYRIVERDALECHYEFVVHPLLRHRSRLILTPLLGGN